MGVITEIEQDLQRIEEAIADMAQEVYTTYQGYLQVLGQGMRQQLILASYHICTQGYPQEFLKLSFSQRQKMQEELREKSKFAAQELQKLLNRNPESKPKSNDSSFAELMKILLNEEEKQKDQVEPKVKEKKETIEFDSSELFASKISAQPKTDSQDQEAEEKEEEKANETEGEKIKISPEDIIDKLSDIDTLISWQENIEEQIPVILKKLSHLTNCILQKVEILPKKIPAKVLEAATKMESADSPVGGRPHILNLLIQAEDADDDDDDDKITRMMAINLQLSEIEFTDINVASWRKKVRSLLGKVSQLQREYHKKQRELAVMEAESAWRSSWYED
ncbi:hypothetical protein [Okeania sp.]|uniref:hypothetical protein n=1 Tax=Okeania sp. TaxID=3100323 RepID=UPI002B4AD33E|nr:hypothetical protein [Okeania sp.]MEB3343383.1 hypothetical protein [Okeania sp.]